MCAGQGRWHRSHQGRDLQQNSASPRECWWRFPEGATAWEQLGRFRTLWKKQIKSRVSDLGASAQETGLRLFQKQGGSSELRKMEHFIHKTNPMQSRTNKKTTKPEKTSGKPLWGRCRKEENLTRSQAQNEAQGEWGGSCSLPGTDPAHFCSPKMMRNSFPWSSGHSWDQRLCYLQLRKFPWCFPAPLFHQNEEKLCHKVKSS